VQLINKIALLIGLTEGMINIKDEDRSMIFNHRVVFGDILPRDMVQELSQIQQELKAGLESRSNAMVRLGKDNIVAMNKEILEDSTKNPMFYGITPVSMPSGNRLVNPETGKVLLEGKEPEVKESNANPQVDFKN